MSRKQGQGRFVCVVAVNGMSAVRESAEGVPFRAPPSAEMALKCLRCPVLGTTFRRNGSEVPKVSRSEHHLPQAQVSCVLGMGGLASVVGQREETPCLVCWEGSGDAGDIGHVVVARPKVGKVEKQRGDLVRYIG